MAELLAITPNRIKELRTQFRMTQNDLADAIGVSQQTIARWESMKVEIPMTALRKLAIKLGCTVNDIVHLEDKMSVALKAVDKSREQLWGGSQHDVPWGGLYVSLNGQDEPLGFPIDLLTYELVRDTLKELSKSDDDFLAFSTLDNRFIVMNLGCVKELTLLTDDVEPMPEYYPAEIYRYLEKTGSAYSVEALKELDEHAAQVFSDEERRLNTTSGILVVTKDGQSHSAYAAEDVVNEVANTLQSNKNKFIAINTDMETERYINVDAIAYVSIPLIKFKLFMAKTDLESIPYEY